MTPKRSASPGRRRAVALRYRHDMPAPIVVSKGSGSVAERLIEIATSLDITIVERPELADVLQMVEIGDYIPEDLYRMVAELLAFVNRIEGGSSAVPSTGGGGS